MREGFRASASTSVDTSFKLCDRITFGSPKLDPTTPQNLEENVDKVGRRAWKLYYLMKVERQSFCLEERDPKSGFSDSMADTTMLKEECKKCKLVKPLNSPMHCECTGLPDHEGNSFILDARQALETNPVGGLAEGIHDLVDRRGERQLTALLDHVQPEVGCLEPEMADNVMKVVGNLEKEAPSWWS